MIPPIKPSYAVYRFPPELISHIVWLYPIFPGWARLTPETLLLGRSPVNPRTCPPADLGREELLNLGPGADPG